MSACVNRNELLTSFETILNRVLAGEEIIIVDTSGPIARLVAVTQAESDARMGFGMLKGKIWIADDFNAPLPEEELREWEK